MLYILTPTWQELSLPGEIINFLNGFTLIGIPAVILIPVLIELVKRGTGLPTHWTGAVSIGVSVIVFVLIAVINAWPQVEYWVTLALGAIIFGLACNGLYSQFQLFRKGNPTHPGETPQVVGAPSDNRTEDND